MQMSPSNESSSKFSNFLIEQKNTTSWTTAIVIANGCMVIGYLVVTTTLLLSSVMHEVGWSYRQDAAAAVALAAVAAAAAVAVTAVTAIVP
jgi:hypothetical protein